MDFLIRPIKVGDGAGLNELRRMPGVFENILGIPSERVKRSEEFIENMDSNIHHFVAVTKIDDNQELIIGSIGLHVHSNLRNRHKADIGMMVHKDYQGRGVGTKLMEAALDIADNWLMLVRVELSVFVDNDKAISLYKKFGFDIEGTMKKAGIRSGEYVDEYMMARVK